MDGHDLVRHLSTYIPPERFNRLRMLRARVRPRGILITASPGTMKSRLAGRGIMWQDVIQGEMATVVFDPVGALTDQFYAKMCEQEKEIQEQLWPRVIHCDMSGKSGHVLPFPLYYRVSDDESLFESALRFLEVIRLCDANLLQAPINGWNALYLIGIQVGMILASLGLPASEAISLLDTPEQWTQRCHQAVATYPEVFPAVEFFKKHYISWSWDKRGSRTETFRTKLLPFLLDPSLKAMCCATTPGIDWNTVEKKRMVVILDFRHIHDMERKRFLSLWALKSFLAYIKDRGAGYEKTMFSLVIDELKYFFSVTDSEEGDKAFAKELIELNDVYARNMRIAPLYITQDPLSFGEHTRQSLFSIGTQIIGPVHNHEAAQMLAEAFFSRDPMKVKYYQPVYVMMDDLENAVFFGRQMYIPKRPVIIDWEPLYYPLDEQVHVTLETIKYLKNYHFLVRPALEHGISARVHHITIEHMDKGYWPNPKVSAKVREILSKKSGIPVEKVLADINQHALVPQLSSVEAARSEPPPSSAVPQKPQRPIPNPPYGAGRRFSLPAVDPDTDDDIR